MQFSKKQFDAILAGLALLQTALQNRLVLPDDGEIGDILTDNGSHEGLTAEEVGQLSEAFNCGDFEADTSLPVVVLESNGGAVYGSRSSQPLRLIILDEDVENSDGESVMKINNAEYYVHDHQLTEKPGPGLVYGIDAEFVVDVARQIDAATA